MRFSTYVEVPKSNLEISHETRVIMLGSCFAQNIGQKLMECKFLVDINPFGILYNPFSICEALDYICSDRLFDEACEEIFFHSDMWHSWLHHSDFSRSERAGVVDAVNSRLLVAKDAFASLDVLMLTFGTAYVYRRVSDGRVVGNCHKVPQKQFTRSLLTVDEIVGRMSSVIDKMLVLRPSMRILFTVSPIRHLRDGAHDNQISKATLLLAVDELCRKYPDAAIYFPSYEIVLDELRDYRFFAEDMVHPSAMAVEYLWERFAEAYFSAATKRLNDELKEIVRALAHRPFDATSQAHRAFLSKIMLKIEDIRKKYPYFDFGKEIAQCNTQLER